MNRGFSFLDRTRFGFGASRYKAHCTSFAKSEVWPNKFLAICNDSKYWILSLSLLAENRHGFERNKNKLSQRANLYTTFQARIGRVSKAVKHGSHHMEGKGIF
jgi:hypothetical protein